MWLLRGGDLSDTGPEAHRCPDVQEVPARTRLGSSVPDSPSMVPLPPFPKDRKFSREFSLSVTMRIFVQKNAVSEVP